MSRKSNNDGRINGDRKKEHYSRCIFTLKEIDEWVPLGDFVKILVTKFPEELIYNGRQGDEDEPTLEMAIQRITRRFNDSFVKGNLDPKIWIYNGTGVRQIRIASGDKEASLLTLTEKLLLEKGVKSGEDMETTITRKEREKRDSTKWISDDTYRYGEFKDIASSLNKHFNLDLEVDHAWAIMCDDKPGQHHPDNLHLLSKRHNVIKNNFSSNRFTIEEQEDYITDLVTFNKKHSDRLNLRAHGTEKVLEKLFIRLEAIYDDDTKTTGELNDS